jgi:hypothetical protein
MTTIPEAKAPADEAKKTLAEVEAIEDAEERAREAYVLWRKADLALSRARRRRDAACLHLLRNEGWQPVRIYRLAGISRRLFQPIAASAPIGTVVPVVSRAEHVVEREGKRFWEAKAELAKVARVRREAARQMLAEGRRNVEVHEASGLSTAWVTAASKGQ